MITLALLDNNPTLLHYLEENMSKLNRRSFVQGQSLVVLLVATPLAAPARKLAQERVEDRYGRDLGP